MLLLTQIRSLAAVDGEGIGAVFTLRVRVIEDESVAAGLQRGSAWHEEEGGGKR